MGNAALYENSIDVPTSSQTRLNNLGKAIKTPLEGPTHAGVSILGGLYPMLKSLPDTLKKIEDYGKDAMPPEIKKLLDFVDTAAKLTEYTLSAPFGIAYGAAVLAIYSPLGGLIRNAAKEFSKFNEEYAKTFKPLLEASGFEDIYEAMDNNPDIFSNIPYLETAALTAFEVLIMGGNTNKIKTNFGINDGDIKAAYDFSSNFANTPTVLGPNTIQNRAFCKIRAGWLEEQANDFKRNGLIPAAVIIDRDQIQQAVNIAVNNPGFIPPLGVNPFYDNVIATNIIDIPTIASDLGPNTNLAQQARNFVNTSFAREIEKTKDTVEVDERIHIKSESFVDELGTLLTIGYPYNLPQTEQALGLIFNQKNSSNYAPFVGVLTVEQQLANDIMEQIFFNDINAFLAWMNKSVGELDLRVLELLSRFQYNISSQEDINYFRRGLIFADVSSRNVITLVPSIRINPFMKPKGIAMPAGTAIEEIAMSAYSDIFYLITETATPTPFLGKLTGNILTQDEVDEVSKVVNAWSKGFNSTSDTNLNGISNLDNRALTSQDLQAIKLLSNFTDEMANIYILTGNKLGINNFGQTISELDKIVKIGDQIIEPAGTFYDIIYTFELIDRNTLERIRNSGFTKWLRSTEVDKLLNDMIIGKYDTLEATPEFNQDYITIIELIKNIVGGNTQLLTRILGNKVTNTGGNLVPWVVNPGNNTLDFTTLSLVIEYALDKSIFEGLMDGSRETLNKIKPFTLNTKFKTILDAQLLTYETRRRGINYSDTASAGTNVFIKNDIPEPFWRSKAESINYMSYKQNQIQRSLGLLNPVGSNPQYGIFQPGQPGDLVVNALSESMYNLNNNALEREMNRMAFSIPDAITILDIYSTQFSNLNWGGFSAMLSALTAEELLLLLGYTNLPADFTYRLAERFFQELDTMNEYVNSYNPPGSRNLFGGLVTNLEGNYGIPDSAVMLNDAFSLILNGYSDNTALIQPTNNGNVEGLLNLNERIERITPIFERYTLTTPITQSTFILGVNELLNEFVLNGVNLGNYSNFDAFLAGPDARVYNAWRVNFAAINGVPVADVDRVMRDVRILIDTYFIHVWEEVVLNRNNGVTIVSITDPLLPLTDPLNREALNRSLYDLGLKQRAKKAITNLKDRSAINLAAITNLNTNFDTITGKLMTETNKLIEEANVQPDNLNYFQYVGMKINRGERLNVFKRSQALQNLFHLNLS